MLDWPWLNYIQDESVLPPVKCPQAAYVIALFSNAQLVGTVGKQPTGAQIGGLTVFGSLSTREMNNPYLAELQELEKMKQAQAK